jgi:hypothetical protein
VFMGKNVSETLQNRLLTAMLLDPHEEGHHRPLRRARSRLRQLRGEKGLMG